MLVLFETAAGFGIFKVLDEKKLKQADNLEKLFETKQKASKIIELQEFRKFADAAEALQAGVACNEGKICKPLKKLLKKTYVDDVKDQLMVFNPKLGTSINEKLNIKVSSGGIMAELMRCINCQIEPLIPGLEAKELKAMELGLAHNLSRYKLKFSPDKVDTMIIQAINLLDDLDKELNNYTMRAREWYGWHFPELSKILPDHVEYMKTVLAIGTRENVATTDLSDILYEDVAQKIKEAAEVSMGTEVNEEDILNIQFLCKEVQDLSEYRSELSEYLINRMSVISPNLTIIVGELVGARLISHAGSLMNLAKLPASTIQLLGAEKALFSALKSKVATPKYGIIYHASLVSTAGAKFKGKMARMLAAKAALASRCDALSENDNSATDFSINNKSKLSSRMKMMEEGYDWRISCKGRSQNSFGSNNRQSDYNGYNNGAGLGFGGKRKGDFNQEEQRPAKKFKQETETTEYENIAKEIPSALVSSEKKKKTKKERPETEEDNQVGMESSGKKKKKSKADKEIKEEIEAVLEPSPKKKKKVKLEKETEEEIQFVSESSKKKKKVKIEKEIEEIPSPTKSSEKKKKKRKSEDIPDISDVDTPVKKKKKKNKDKDL